MKRIKLTRGKYALVDDEDYGRLNKDKWYAEKNGKTFYAARNIRNSDGKRALSKMHRELMGNPVGKLIDHKDENGLNNQKYNLRVCTRSQNQMNRGKTKNNTSGYKGVSWHRRIKKWGAHIRANNKLKHLGYFDNKNDAAKAYNEAATEYHGEFAQLNKIPSDNVV